MTFGYIYKIVFSNGKHYIGLTTTSIEQRQKQHRTCAKSGDTKCLYNALRKYGMEDTFELIQIDTADTIEELCKKEIEYIAEYNSYYMNGNGYNMTHGGEGTFGYVYTEEARKEQSNRIKKYFEDNPEAGKEHGETMKKYYEDNPEARQQMSKIKKQYHNENPEAGKEQGKKLKSHYENPEARKKNSEAMKKYYEDNPEAKEQMSKIKKKQWENPEAKEQMSKIKKKYYEDNSDARQKLSDGKGKNKPFDVFTKDGTFIKTFTYQFEAKEYLEKEYDIFIFLSNISAVLSGKRNNTIGFIFKYK